MSVRNIQAGYQQGASTRAPADDSDAEEEALANDYQEQVRYEEDDQDRDTSIGSGPQDLQGQLVGAAQPLEYGATLETKIASYDSYCNLFHYILNSDGPVDLEVPSVCATEEKGIDQVLTYRSTTGPGKSSMSSSTNSTPSAHTAKRLH